MFGMGSIEALSRGLNWLTFTIIGLILPAEQFGVYAVVLATLLIFSSLSVSGQDRVVLRYLNASMGIIKAALTLGFLGGIAFTAVLLVILEFKLITLSVSIPLLIIWMLMTSQITLLISIARAENNVFAFFVLRTLYISSKLIGVLIIIFNTPTADALILFECILSIVFFIMGIYCLKNSIKSPLTQKNLSKAATFGLPFVLHVAAGSSLGHIDKLMLSNATNNELIAQYSFLNAIAGGMFFIYAILNIKNETLIYQQKEQNKAEKSLSSLLKTSLLLASIATIALNLILPIVLSALGKQHLYDQQVLLILSLSYFIYPFYLQANIRFAWYEKPMIIPFITLISAIINIVCNLLLIPIYGILGAAISTLISYVVLCISTQIISRRLMV